MRVVKPLIISASRRTDIPAFYMDWFLSEWEKGWTEWVNPFNRKQVRIVSFENTKIVVFWSKYPIGILKNSDKIDFEFLLLYTLNDYPELEKKLPPLERRIELFKEISRIFGKERVIWRFDPLVFLEGRDTKLISKFERISLELEGYTKRVIVSVFTPYGKAVRRMEKAGFVVRDPEEEEIREIGSKLKEIAEKRGMEIQTCADRYWKVFEEVGVKRGACIDAGYIAENFKHLEVLKKLKKDRGQRDLCLCVESVDIGRYNTCKFGCLYCYAV